MNYMHVIGKTIEVVAFTTATMAVLAYLPCVVAYEFAKGTLNSEIGCFFGKGTGGRAPVIRSESGRCVEHHRRSRIEELSLEMRILRSQITAAQTGEIEDELCRAGIWPHHFYPVIESLTPRELSDAFYDAGIFQRGKGMGMLPRRIRNAVYALYGVLNGSGGGIKRRTPSQIAEELHDLEILLPTNRIRPYAR